MTKGGWTVDKFFPLSIEDFLLAQSRAIPARSTADEKINSLETKYFTQHYFINYWAMRNTST